MIWQNQENGEPSLVGFRVSRCWKMQNISANKAGVFFAFLSNHYGFTNYLEILIFFFTNFIPRVVSTCRVLKNCNSLANSYQILRWIMSKPASHEVLGKIILFVLEFRRLKEWNLDLDQIITWKMKLITSFSLLLHFAILFWFYLL